MRSVSYVLKFSMNKDIKVNVRDLSCFDFENYSRNSRGVCAKTPIK